MFVSCKPFLIIACFCALREIVLGFHLAGKEVVATVVPQPHQNLFKVSMELSDRKDVLAIISHLYAKHSRARQILRHSGHT